MASAKKATPSPSRGVPVPEARRRAAKQVLKLLEPGMRVALMTHVNADGDGAGSEVALWHLLTQRDIRAAITNPTPFPERFAFLLGKAAGADKSSSGVKYLERADAIVVLDIADLDRLGHLARVVERVNVPVACIDHHVSNGTLPPGPRLVDAAACATGELIYDLARAARWELTPHVARALYVAVLTDTGGFRFSNTSPRTLHVAAHLLERGLDAEQIYREVYASEPEGKIRLLGEVLETLVVEPQHQLAWMTVPPGAMERHAVDASDLDGIVEFARAVRGVQLAILFRELANGRIKASFRSVGHVDVARMAESFGGGGHRKAAGASLEGTLAEVQAIVLDAARSVARP
ncbi:MAG: bifunctional oligoribonuclease/PAP phosphatase NrnA [Gemmatimonadota bacterium]|nr:MAG: bifunctional oligoribonuclease/PAP phosphatase NrnA [Gemmatimonadota bacterium]